MFKEHRYKFLTLLFVAIGSGVLIIIITFLFFGIPKIRGKFNGNRRTATSSIDALQTASDIQTRKTYQEAKEDNPNSVINPNITNSDINPNPQNYVLEINGSGFLHHKTVINQGDVVTWKNYSGRDVFIQGDDWGSIVPIESGRGFSQEFDFVGSYKYDIIVESKVKEKGEVVVRSIK